MSMSLINRPQPEGVNMKEKFLITVTVVVAVVFVVIATAVFFGNNEQLTRKTETSKQTEPTEENGYNQTTCTICNRWFDKSVVINGLCNECRKEGWE